MHFRIGVLGGTFDPIHSAHIAAAHTAIDQLSLDWVYFVPAGSPYHRELTFASPSQRAQMTELAIAGDPRLRVSSVDLSREGNTYTIDTLNDLQEEFSSSHPTDSAEWFLILGADAFASFDNWRGPESIAQTADLVVISRPGSHRKEFSQFPAQFIEIPGWEVSSTQIREKLAAGESVQGLLPEVVIQYIRNNDLYSTTKRK